MSKVLALGVLFAAAAFITLMNQLLCWFCPPACDVRTNGLEWIVCRTVSKSLTGLLLCGMAIAVGWRRWLSAGPFVCCGFRHLVSRSSWRCGLSARSRLRNGVEMRAFRPEEVACRRPRDCGRMSPDHGLPWMHAVRAADDGWDTVAGFRSVDWGGGLAGSWRSGGMPS